MEKSHFLRRFLVAGSFALVTLVGISIFSGSVSQAGDGYSSLWSAKNAPVFYGTTKMILQKDSVLDLKDARMRIWARDFEDGDLSAKITVKSNNVDVTTVGEYMITYSVTDTHKNTATQNVPVSIVENDEGNYFEKTLYALPNMSYMNITGARGNAMDRQVMGFMLGAEQTVEAKQISGSAKLSLYGANGELSSQKTLNNTWQTFSASGISALLAETPAAKAVVALRSPAEVKALPYYNYGDDEAAFRASWTAAGKSVAVIENQSVMFYATANDKAAAWTGLDATLASFDKLINKYDALLGYAYNSAEPWNQNVKAKYFVRGGGNCVGEAVYTSGAVMLCKATTPTSNGFKLSFAMAHALAHGYVGSGLVDATLGITEDVAVNIVAYFAKDALSLSGSWPEPDEALAAMQAKLTEAGYEKTYAELAMLTRKLNAGGTLAEHDYTKRYEMVTKTPEDGEGQGVEGTPGEDEEKPGQGEGRPGEGEEGQGGEGDKTEEGDKPGEGEEKPEEKPPVEKDPEFEPEKPSKDVFTVIAESSQNKPVENNKTVAKGNAVVNVVATAKPAGTQSPVDDSNAIIGAIDNPLADTSRNENSLPEKEDKTGTYVVIGVTMAAAAVGLALIWTRGGSKKKRY